jgi:hypothetical protein
MKDLFKRLAAIEGLMVPMSERLALMEETMADQGKQQTILHVALTNVERSLQDTDRGHNTNNASFRRHAPDHDDEPGEDRFLTSRKIRFPKFDGTGDPLPWLNRCDRYFYVRTIQENKV